MSPTGKSSKAPLCKGCIVDRNGQPVSQVQVVSHIVNAAKPQVPQSDVSDEKGHFLIAFDALQAAGDGQLKIDFLREGVPVRATQRLVGLDDVNSPVIMYELDEHTQATVDTEAHYNKQESIPTVAITSHDFMTDEHEAMWASIQNVTVNIGFANFLAYVDKELANSSCAINGAHQTTIDEHSQLFNNYGVNSYELLDSITEKFMYERIFDHEAPKHGDYLQHIVESKLPDWQVESRQDECTGSRLQIGRQHLKPLAFCPIELIWSYWIEESLLMQAFNRIALRFQNRSSVKQGPDPLAHLEIDPLRPLNNLIWGFIQNEGKRLSLVRRAYEYDHHYGIQLQGTAVPKLRPADSRVGFLGEFHKLLHIASEFHRQTDDVTVRADPFPVMNAIYDVHIKLAEGAHNQFGDLPTVARKEMLMMQWIMARPEMREFLNGRLMVPQSEGWMDRVEHMKRIQGWPNHSMQHFVNLANFGEQLMVSIRNVNWSQVKQSSVAGSWATYWRESIQGYMHSYRAVTGIDILDNDPRMSDNPSAAIYKQSA